MINESFGAILIFGGVTAVVLGCANLIYELVFLNRVRVRQRLDHQFGDTVAQRMQNSALFRDLQDRESGAMFRLPTLMLGIRTYLDQAGVAFSISQIGICAIALSAATGLLALVTLNSKLIAAIVSGAALITPAYYVYLKRRRRLLTLTRQLPDAFDVMSRALKAGQAVTAAFQLVAKDFSSPLAEEFSHCYEQQHLGVAQEVALRDLARRTGIMELQIFVVAMIINSRSGGNLAELLAKLATLLRKRSTMQSRIRAMTGEGRLQAAVLIALPFLVFIGIYLLNRSYAEILLNHPYILGLCGVSQTLGAICIRYIIRIDL